jgi:hypothetical protein
MDHWRLERVYGEHPGYVLALLCADGHIHYAAMPYTYMQARQLMRRFTRVVFGPEHPGWFIDEDGVAILPGLNGLV